MYDVIRNFGVDYIYFDTAFVAVFLFLLIKNKKLLPLVAFFVGGFLINFFVDWGIWLHSGIREIILPHQNPTNIILFFLWFSLSYGVEYAYVFLMFENTSSSSKLKWTALVFFGWILTAVLSQNLHLNDANISTIRHMSDMRLLRLGIVILGFGILFLKKYGRRKILFLFFVGFLIHFMMEFALLISGIRPGSFWILAENSLIEFNMGMPFFYLIYQKLNKDKNPTPPKQDWVTKKAENKKTPNKGFGLFAIKNIKAGENVVIWGGEYVDKETAEKAKDQGKLVMQFDDNLFSIEDRGESPAYFINHSCEPNVWMNDAFTLQAMREIFAGEEITADYAMWESREGYVSRWNCQCKTPHCRLKVTGQDWKIPRLQEKYKNHFIPMINKRIENFKK